MRFTHEFGITRRKKDDWFDLELSADTPLYVDPFLVFTDADPFWSSAHDDLIAFFSLAQEYVRAADGNRSGPAWNKAKRMLTFPEPKEFALGLAMGSPDGAGTGPKYATKMASALQLINALPDGDSVKYLESFVLFCDGLGVDRISDAFCNVIKARFIEYTAAVVGRHQLPTTNVPVKHASWLPSNGRWNDLRLQLPKSPVTTGGVLLVPERFLKDIPRVTAEGFWGWAQNNEAAVLREDLNYDLAKSLTKRARAAQARAVARARPDFVLRYVEQQQKGLLLPYDVHKDPALRVGWAEVGRAAASTSTTTIVEPSDESDFMDWVKSLALDFKHQVESADLWRALWNDALTKPRMERIVQAIAGAMWVTQCRSANIDISKEPNMGRGPVDFKFSRGWEDRALLEVKKMTNKKFVHGAETQLPQYLKTERIRGGVYLVIGYSDADFEKSRVDRVRDACTALTEAKGVEIEPIFVDARPGNKTSASKIHIDE